MLRLMSKPLVRGGQRGAWYSYYTGELGGELKLPRAELVMIII
jgi:hypothetical protein